jgi:hypothetical protein
MPPTVRVVARDLDGCDFCVTDFADDGSVLADIAVTTCGHHLHVQCIQKLSDDEHVTCPMCQAEVSLTDVGDVIEEYTRALARRD